MSEFLYDKAIMALKAQRYDEAQSSYEQVLQGGYSVEAWTGLGVCKMFQIADGRTMEEVLYCFEKARNVEGADNREIDLKLLQYSQIVILKCGAFAIAAINNAIEAEKKAATAALISIASIAVGSLSNSTGTKILAGAAAATSVGVAVGQFGKMTSSKEIAKYATDLLADIYKNVYGFLLDKDKMEEAVELKKTTDKLCSDIQDSLDPKIKAFRDQKELEDKQLKELIEAQEVIDKADAATMAELNANQTDEIVIAMANSFHDQGNLQTMNFSVVTVVEVLQLLENDNVLFYIDADNGSCHYFCDKGVIKAKKQAVVVGSVLETRVIGPVFYNYSDLSDPSEKWLGNLKYKSSGYQIFIPSAAGSKWRTSIIDFINEKRNGLPPASEDVPAQAVSESSVSEPAASKPAASEPAASKPAASEPAASEPAASEPAVIDQNSFNNLSLLPFDGEYKEVIESHCTVEDNFQHVIVDATKAVIVFGENGVVWYFQLFGSVNLKYYKYNDIIELKKSWTGTLKDKKSGFKISLQDPKNWDEIITEFIKSKQD
jgi:tetratricopeptide (TPR) repeat protein